MPRPPKRPGTVTFIAVVLIILGVFSLIGGLISIAGIVGAALAPEQPGPAQPGDAAAIHRFFGKEVTGYYPMMFASLAVNMLFGLGQLIAGIGLFRMSSPARMMAILLSLGKLLFACVGHVYNIALVIPAQKRFFDLNPPLPAGQGAPFDIGVFTQVLTIVALVVTILVQLTLCGLIVIMLSTKGTRDAFAAAGSPQPEDEDKPRSRYEGYDDDDYGAAPPKPKSPGDTGITERGD